MNRQYRGLVVSAAIVSAIWVQVAYERATADISGYVLRGKCGPWPEWLKLEYIGGNLLITFDYFLIPSMLVIGFRKTTAPGRVYWLMFALFISFCGNGHTIEGVLSFWWPNYPFFSWWNIATGSISLITAMMLPTALQQWMEKEAEKRALEIVAQQSL